MGAFDLLVNPQGSFGERYGLGALAELVTGQAHVPKRARFAVPVPDCARDLEGQVVVLNGAAGLAQSVVGIAQVAQHGPFPAAVPEFPGGGQGLFVAADPPARAAPPAATKPPG